MPEVRSGPAIIGDGETKLGTAKAEEVGPVRVYADFERSSGGLLRVLQGGLFIAQSVVLRCAPLGRWWSPAVLLPLYVAYFTVRGPLWRALYRRFGHAEVERAVRRAKWWAWWGFPAIAALYVVSVTQSQGLWFSPWAGLGWLAAFWVPVIVLGRLEVDWSYFWFHWMIVSSALRFSAEDMTGWFLFAGLALAGAGLWEHRTFQRVMEGWPRQ